MLAAALVAGCATDTEKLVGVSTGVVAALAVASAANVWDCTARSCAATPLEQTIVFGSAAGVLAIVWAVVAATHYNPLKL